MIKKVYRLNGEAINIGDWDYQFDANGIAENPLPDGVSTSDEECVIGWDGGLYVADDPAADG
ncbi:hypothetical protein KW456_04515 [Vibrio fluvialis]|nr:hypothetical protein [Vibrio fluvialis]